MHARRSTGVALLAATLAFGVAAATANVVLTRVSADPFTNPTSQHATEVEPDTFAFPGRAAELAAEDAL